MHQLTPLHSSPNTFPVIAIAIIGILSTALLLLCYYIFVIKCCLSWHRFDILNRFSSHQTTHPSSHFPSSRDLDPPKGLDESIIRLIPLIKFHKQSKPQPETYECAVCLSEFKDGERLRVIPICCHAFHIDCIDIWLQDNASCPLCRSGIDLNSIFLLNNNNNNYNNMSSRDQGFVVVEIQGNNNVDEHRFVCNVGEKKKNGKKMEQIIMGSIGDEWIDMRGKDEEFRVSQPVRRSISMDLSIDRETLLEIRRCCGDTQEEGIFCSSSKVRRCLFSFSYGGNCRGCSYENMN